MANTIQMRRGTAANATTNNVVLAAGEWGYETDTAKVKIGDGVTAWNDLAYFETGGGGSTEVVAKTGTSVVFTENAEYYADGSFNPNLSGNITLSLTGAVVGTSVVIAVADYTPTISGEPYILLSDTSNGVRDLYYFYYAHDGLKLNIIGQGVLTTPVVTLTPADTEIQVNWTQSIGATSYTVIRNTANTPTGGTTIYTGALLTFTDTGLTNGTTYYYFVKATGGTAVYNSAFGTNSGAPEAYGADAFVFNVKTDNAGTSTSTQFAVPTASAGTYNCTVDWGDGNTNTITTWNDAAWTHTYAVAGEYRVIITGISFKSMQFNNGGDKAKLLNIENWGFYHFLSSGSFYGCSNLTITATDTPNLTSVTTLAQSFQGCTALTSIPNLNTWAAVSGSYSGFFRSCTNFNQDISGMQIGGATNLSSFLRDCSNFNNLLPTAATPSNTTFASFLENAVAFNQDVSVLDFSAVTTCALMFSGCSAFNHASISSINVSNVTAFTFMLRSTAVDRSLADWDVRNATGLSSATGFLDNRALSTANYDATLIGWDTRTPYNVLDWDFGTSTYTTGGAGETARTSLIGKGLTFTDGGGV